MLSIEQVKQMNREKALEVIANTCNYSQVPATEEEFPELFKHFNISENEFVDIGGCECYSIMTKEKYKSLPKEPVEEYKYDIFDF